MADCVMFGRCVGVRSYTKKDGTVSTVLSLSDSHGQVVQFFGSGKWPEYPFGSTLKVAFDIGLFNGKPSSLRFQEFEEVKSK